MLGCPLGGKEKATQGTRSSLSNKGRYTTTPKAPKFLLIFFFYKSFFFHSLRGPGSPFFIAPTFLFFFCFLPGVQLYLEGGLQWPGEVYKKSLFKSLVGCRLHVTYIFPVHHQPIKNLRGKKVWPHSDARATVTQFRLSIPIFFCCFEVKSLLLLERDKKRMLLLFSFLSSGRSSCSNSTEGVVWQSVDWEIPHDLPPKTFGNYCRVGEWVMDPSVSPFSDSCSRSIWFLGGFTPAPPLYPYKERERGDRVADGHFGVDPK